MYRSPAVTSPRTGYTQSPVNGVYEPYYPHDNSVHQVNLSNRTPSVPRHNHNHPPVVRTFNILLTDNSGNRWYERDVTCSRAADLVGILQSRVGIPIREVLYQGQVLTDTHLSHVPDELKLTLATFTGQPVKSPSKHLTLLVENTPKRVTLDVASVTELHQKLGDMGVRGTLLSRVPGTDQYEPLQNLDGLTYEHPLRVVPEGGEGPLFTNQRYVSRSASYTPVQPASTQRGPAQHEPVSIQSVMIEAGHLLMQGMPNSEDELIASATARITQQFRQMYNTAETGREPANAELAYLRSIVEQYLTMHVRVEGQDPNHAQNVVSAQPSVFKSVTFGIAGAFPVLEARGNCISLSPPAQAVTGQPVVVLAHAVNEMPIDIRCTLGYENEESKVIVINIDEFYVNGWVTIGKTSPLSLFLSFQPDVLRAGVRYFIDITAFASDNPTQKIGGAQTEFTMRDSAAPSARRTSNAQVAPQPSAQLSAQRSLSQNSEVLDGYFQQQLREFIEMKILPLYALSTNPRFTEKTFNQMVDDACGDLWDLPPNQELSEVHKKTLLGRVKQGLLNSS
eukprot:TRINITY_DN9425_c0_g2_i1.p1 TRINITY_DN9425_c0_g2~~TRINITY_DN9425_c0_g2_i1.p1  ORF type:complete len:565 (+),score=130.24 TRINITY_DN9425_c0_g2_i1:706-2400(+)